MLIFQSMLFKKIQFHLTPQHYVFNERRQIEWENLGGNEVFFLFRCKKQWILSIRNEKAVNSFMI